MVGNKFKRYKVLPNAYIYERPRSPYFWGYLKINGIQYRKSMKTDNKPEAERNLIDWKQELLTSPDSSASLTPYAFRTCADDYLKIVEMKSQPKKSGQTLYQKVYGLIYSPSSKNGLIHTFKDQDIRSITNEDVNRYIGKLIQENLSNNRIADYTDCLKQIIVNKNENPKFNIKVTGGKKSEQRGFLNLGNYRRLKNACNKFGGQKLTQYGTRKVLIDADLYPLVVFLVGTMIRPTVKECFDIRKKDIAVRKNSLGKEYLQLTIARKVSATQTIPSMSSAVGAYRELNKRHKLKPDDFICCFGCIAKIDLPPVNSFFNPE